MVKAGPDSIGSPDAFGGHSRQAGFVELSSLGPLC
jgi:hypothetical protein